jgi:hypothetical protein
MGGASFGEFPGGMSITIAVAALIGGGLGSSARRYPIVGRGESGTGTSTRSFAAAGCLTRSRSTAGLGGACSGGSGRKICIRQLHGPRLPGPQLPGRKIGDRESASESGSAERSRGPFMACLHPRREHDDGHLGARRSSSGALGSTWQAWSEWRCGVAMTGYTTIHGEPRQAGRERAPARSRRGRWPSAGSLVGRAVRIAHQRVVHTPASAAKMRPDGVIGCDERNAAYRCGGRRRGRIARHHGWRRSWEVECSQIPTDPRRRSPWFHVKRTPSAIRRSPGPRSRPWRFATAT